MEAEESVLIEAANYLESVVLPALMKVIPDGDTVFQGVDSIIGDLREVIKRERDLTC